ncbi:cobyrinate a,c-diamide synthase [Carnimonas bestiolae]|uniref:cobyrinate a,c-diamide synthase n=1 Tax=Carnimonas bestiolae TaxID=3402172 RepID=UPI003EDBA454
MASPNCPALFISAPASGQGKTTVTAALARLHQRHGRTVRIFKTGPDYLDPLVLQQASGAIAEPLDLWMTGEAGCREALALAAQQADLILIEGAMGLYDGTPSSADLAIAFGIDVVAVFNARGMAQSIAALAHGLASYHPRLTLTGIVANQIGSARHHDLIETALPAQLPLLASIKRNPSNALPSRHLGLIPPDQHNDLEAIIERVADELEGTALAQLPRSVSFPIPQQADVLPQQLAGVRIGIARDQAFSFIYPANLRLLEAMGAELHFFSPLHDQQLPRVDALWLPGGYPELYAGTLADNAPMLAALNDHYQSGRPILAECGGLLYVLEELIDIEGQCHPMAGLMSGSAAMRERSGCQGMQSAPLPEGQLRGHAHHRSVASGTPEPIAYGIRPSHPAPGEAVFRQGRLTASYIHLFFPSNPTATAALFTPDKVDAS